MIRGVHTMFYSDKTDELRAFLRDKLGFPATDVGGGWLIFAMPDASRAVSGNQLFLRVAFRSGGRRNEVLYAWVSRDHSWLGPRSWRGARHKRYRTPAAGTTPRREFPTGNHPPQPFHRGVSWR